LCPLVAGLFTKVNNSMAVADTRIVGGGSWKKWIRTMHGKRWNVAVRGFLPWNFF
jgi:hypothetical protein